MRQLTSLIDVRSLFEKVLQAIPAEKSRPIWDRFLTFERSIAANRDLSTMASLEERYSCVQVSIENSDLVSSRAKAFPNDSSMERQGLLRVSHRYSYHSLYPSNRDDASFYSMYIASGQTKNETMKRRKEVETNEEDDEKRIPGPILPDCIKPLALLLPLSEPWKGPDTNAAQLFTAILRARFPPRQQVVKDCDELLEKLKQLNKKRPAFKDPNAPSDDESSGVTSKSILSKRPAHDVFRSRQQQKLAKLI